MQATPHDTAGMLLVGFTLYRCSLHPQSSRSAGTAAQPMLIQLFSDPEANGKCDRKCEQGLLPQPDMLACVIFSMGCLMLTLLTGDGIPSLVSHITRRHPMLHYDIRQHV